MKSISKALVGTVAAGAMAMTSAAPAFARDRGHDKIDAGDVIAGAVILGGIAAILSSGKKDRYRDRHYNGRYDHRYDGRRGNGERAVERCIRAAERDARRGGYRYADVTQIRDVDRTRYGWRVKGRIVVEGQRGYGNRYNNRGYNNRYDRGYNYNHRGYNRDQGKFTCTISRGQGAFVDFRGLRGLH
ncbi:hypothetical protein QWY75_02410 [Pontixanthobacter aestiaquae]|uniref:17 kDa surface antigen n=2 Tax=Pontixanthobacter aestiaquae TaxID=1509367 RepID=A0A844Z8X0_9SPHN|nr:hypothetical protein [Pontixanthobacter aestiaquae]MDN3645056.1 hypothetical protein [Pontixanthobacter aestiaquae]MXO83944.1 hypothetical protein [Pontixanthobacter aestiaquae]